MNPHYRTVLLIATLAFSCTARSEAPPQQQQPPQQEQESEEKGIVLTGTLAKTVEEGGWLLKTKEASYLLLNIEKYRAEPWFQAGRKVRVRGEEDPEVITIYMQGKPFKVYSMEPEE